LTRWLGFGDGYELLRRMYFARFGLVPLSMKAERLEELEEAKIYEIQGAPLKGFMVRGRTRRGKRIAWIQLLDKAEELDLRLNFSSTEELEEEELGRIVNTVRITDR
jgi:hypothetical protein